MIHSHKCWPWGDFTEFSDGCPLFLPISCQRVILLLKLRSHSRLSILALLSAYNNSQWTSWAAVIVTHKSPKPNRESASRHRFPGPWGILVPHWTKTDGFSVCMPDEIEFWARTAVWSTFFKCYFSCCKMSTVGCARTAVTKFNQIIDGNDPKQGI